MVQSVIQHSFHAGEWAPALYARVDLAKYKAGAALLENFYVDYRGGASSRPGTRYILQAYKSGSAVRLIPFQASTTVGYVLEFGDLYIRFYNNGAPVLETGINITNVSGNTITAANTYNAGDWVKVASVGGITNINDKYFIVASATGASFTVTDLVGGAITFTGTYTTGGITARVYTLGTSYISADLALLKFTQSVDKLYICHPNYAPAILTLISAANWTLNPIVFGSTVGQPTGLGATTSGSGNSHYGYVVTALDDNGQESAPSTVVYSTVNIASGANVSINLTWNAVSGAKSYNVYRTPSRDQANPPAGSMLGFLMNVTQTSASDSFYSNTPQIAVDYSNTPPIAKNPFGPPGVDHCNITNPGSYSGGVAVPTVEFSAPPSGSTATGSAVLGTINLAITSSSTGWNIGDTFNSVGIGEQTRVVGTVTAIDGSGHVTAVLITSAGSITTTTPTNPVQFNHTPVIGNNPAFLANVTWGVASVNITNPGTGYTTAPSVTFSSGGATATAVLDVVNSGNPSVPGLFQQRLVLAAKPNAIQTFDMSQPGSYTNFDISSPLQADDAITGSIVSGQLNKIVSMISVPTGLILLTSRANWLVQGQQGSAVSPIDIHADAHSYNGASDVPPIVANYDILFIQEKGSIVRDLAFNFYTQIYTGSDISILSSHLFYGHTITEWCWAEEPFKIVWAVRDDGVALSLTFLKEQELIGWSHSVTNGLFKSTATVTEPATFGKIDAVYFVVERVINGNTVKYIERLAERIFTNGAADAWCVDAGLQYSGAPATTFSGAEHLAGATVTGLADGVVIPSFTMPTNGSFTLGTAASKVTIGLAFEPRLKTLPLDIGEPTIAGKRKGINGVTVRVQETLGLYIGKAFDNAMVPMKDLVLGNVGSASNSIVTGLVTGDARTIIDPSWDVPGQYCIKQPNPLPVTILGVIPEIEVGDTK